MSLEELSYLSQIVAAIAVLVTLVFFILEVRRNTRETRRQTLEEATAHRTGFVRMMVADPALIRLVGAGLSGAKMDAAAWYQFSMFLYALFVEYEFNEKRIRAGEMDEELWEAWREAYRWWLQFPGARKWWATRPAGFTPYFRELVDREIATVAEDAQMLAFMAKVSMAGEETPPAA